MFLCQFSIPLPRFVCVFLEMYINFLLLAIHATNEFRQFVFFKQYMFIYNTYDENEFIGSCRCGLVNEKTKSTVRLMFSSRYDPHSSTGAVFSP